MNVEKLKELIEIIKSIQDKECIEENDEPISYLIKKPILSLVEIYTMKTDEYLQVYYSSLMKKVEEIKNEIDEHQEEKWLEDWKLFEVEINKWFDYFSKRTKPSFLGKSLVFTSSVIGIFGIATHNETIKLGCKIGVIGGLSYLLWNGIKFRPSDEKELEDYWLNLSLAALERILIYIQK